MIQLRIVQRALPEIKAPHVLGLVLLKTRTPLQNVCQATGTVHHSVMLMHFAFVELLGEFLHPVPHAIANSWGSKDAKAMQKTAIPLPIPPSLSPRSLALSLG